MFKNGLSPTSSGKQTTFKTNVQAEGGGCTHCGNIKHTPDTCFKYMGTQNGGTSSRPGNNMKPLPMKV